MKKFKVLKATFILLALLFAVIGVAYADDNASKFTDIDDSWAKQYIINVQSKGLMGGVTETQFKPRDYVKNYDALVSISRMINREKDINLVQLEEKYQESVLKKYNVPGYAKEGILVCLDKGIIEKFEIETFSAYPNIMKKDLSKYLGKALGVVVESNAPPAVLGFTDALFIRPVYTPYIKFLIDNGVVNDSGNFNPDSYVDRATFAKMLDKSNEVYEKKVLGQNTTVTESGSTEKTVQDTNTGEETELTDTTVTNPETVVEDTVQADITAYVDEVIAEYSNLSVFVGTERKIYKIADNAECTIDGVSSGFWKLKKSDMVKLFFKADKIIKIAGESKIRKTVGKLVSIETTDKTTLKMEANSGETKNYTITAKTRVIKDGKEALWQELKNGNSLVITTSYDELIEINADGVKSTDKGVIESIVYSRMAPPKLVITALDGSQNTYYSNNSMEITGAGSDVYSLRPGMQVEASLIDDEISKIAVINETISIQAELKGIIKSIDAASQTIVVEVYDGSVNKNVDKKIYLTAETNIVYVDLASLKINSLAIGSLKANQTISIIGTGSADGVLAKTIQLMN